MTEQKRALTDLRPVAEAKLFADWRVTPELKAKLRDRITAAEAQQAPKARSPWIWRGAVTAVAACAMVGLVALGQWNPAPAQPGARGGAPAAAADGEHRGMTADTYGAAKVPEALNAPVAAPPPGSTSFTVAGQPTTAAKVTIKALDQQGVTLTTSAALADGNGNAVQFSGAAPSTANPPIPGVEAAPGRKIVLNAEFNLQVTDAVTAMERLQQLAAVGTGYVVDAALNKGDDGSWAGRLTLRIPSSAYNGTVQDLRRIGEVKQERQWSQDVTDRYYDLESRIRIQQEFEQKLTELAAKASTFDDWLKLTQQINSTRAQIEQMQGSLKLLDNQVEYSTINVAFTQPAPGKEPPKPQEPAKGLGPNMSRAFHRSVGWFAGLGESLLVGLASVAPFAVALVILGIVALLVWRRWRRTRSI